MMTTLRIRLGTLLAAHGDLVVFALALVLRLAWVATLENQLKWFDEQEFADIARHLAAGDGYVSSSFRANPTVPVYLALIFRLFGENFLIARIGQCVMGAAACVLVGRIAASLIGPLAGLISGLLFAVYPPHIYLSGVFYVDSWLTFFCALTVYLTVLVAQGRGGVLLALLCGVSQGLAMLTRPAFLAFLPGPVLSWFVSRSLGASRATRLSVVFLLGCMLTVLPWGVRNYEVFGRPMIASGFWAMLWRGNHELANGGPDDRILQWGTPQWSERLAGLPESRQQELAREYEQIDREVAARRDVIGDIELALDDVLKPLAIDAVVSHPGRTIGLIATKVGTLYSAFSENLTANDQTVQLRRWLAPLAFYPLLALALMGLALSVPRWRDMAPIYCLILSVTAVYALLTACTRFRLPLDPFLIILSSLAIIVIAEALQLIDRSPTDAAARGVSAAGPGTRRDMPTATRRPGPPSRASRRGAQNA